MAGIRVPIDNIHAPGTERSVLALREQPATLDEPPPRYRVGGTVGRKSPVPPRR